MRMRTLILSFTAAIAISRSIDSLVDSGTVMMTGIETEEETVLALKTEAGIEGFGLDTGTGVVARE